jgi:hypothetical protein
MRATCHTHISRLIFIASTFFRPMLYSTTPLIRINRDVKPLDFDFENRLHRKFEVRLYLEYVPASKEYEVAQ